MRRPRSTPRKIQPATERMTADELRQLADVAEYVGSGDHKDIPALGLVPSPRRGSVRFEEAEAQNINNPDCTICPRKWAKRGHTATELLRAAIRSGQISSDAGIGCLPKRVWARDPEDRQIVYEAKRLSRPANGYKAYPLTTRQSRHLPLDVD